MFVGLVFHWKHSVRNAMVGDRDAVLPKDAFLRNAPRKPSGLRHDGMNSICKQNLQNFDAPNFRVLKELLTVWYNSNSENN